MLKQQLSPKNAAMILGSLLILGILLGVGYRFQHDRGLQNQEVQMAWQRDREMGVPNTTANENVSPEERDAARTSQLEKQMAQERTGGGMTVR